MNLSRRGLLRSGAGVAAASTLAACGASASPGRAPEGARTGTQRLFYGDDRRQQFVDVRRPRGRPRGSVVLLHGGYWQAAYGLDLMTPMAERLTGQGFVTANVEYRRVGSGGGWPQTFADVAAAVDRVVEDRVAEEGETRAPVLVGHSAGGHLAGWAASRTSTTPGGAPRRRPRLAVSLSGLLDLSAAASAPESATPTIALMGGTPAEHPERYRLGDPGLLVPAACPVVAVQASGESVIPADQAASYVALARAAGGSARAVEVEGDHFTLIDPHDSSWSRIEALITG